MVTCFFPRKTLKISGSHMTKTCQSKDFLRTGSFMQFLELIRRFKIEKKKKKKIEVQTQTEKQSWTHAMKFWKLKLSVACKFVTHHHYLNNMLLLEIIYYI